MKNLLFCLIRVVLPLTLPSFHKYFYPSHLFLSPSICLKQCSFKCYLLLPTQHKLLPSLGRGRYCFLGQKGTNPVRDVFTLALAKIRIEMTTVYIPPSLTENETSFPWPAIRFVWRPMLPSNLRSIKPFPYSIAIFRRPDPKPSVAEFFSSKSNQLLRIQDRQLSSFFINANFVGFRKIPLPIKKTIFLPIWTENVN